MSIRRKNIEITPAKLRAQRGNARLSHGPRTREGRRRSALNRRGMDRSFVLLRTGRETDARDLLRIWRDLLAQFWFIKPDLWRRPPDSGSCLKLESRLEQVAWAWWRKLRWVRMGASQEDLAKANEWIQSDLSAFLFEFRVGNQKADYWLRKEFGTDGRLNIAALRESIEPRLQIFRELSGRQSSGAPGGAPNAGVARADAGTEPVVPPHGTPAQPQQGQSQRQFPAEGPPPGGVKIRFRTQTAITLRALDLWLKRPPWRKDSRETIPNP
jgi:hypothetical protein